MLLLTLLFACSDSPARKPAATGADDTGEAVETSPGVSLGEVRTCDNPLPGPSYTEQGVEWNLLTPLSEDERYGHQDGAGLAAADVDLDGQVDLLLTRMPGANHLMLRRGDTFEELLLPMPSGNGALWIDVDDSGRPDLLMGGPMAFLLRAGDDGSFAFEPFPELDEPGDPTGAVVHDMTPGDFDGDGRLELFMARTADIHEQVSTHNDRVVHLEPEGLVVEMDAVPEDVGIRHGYDALSFDADDDGDLDVYVANDLGMNFGPSTLLRNDDGAFVDAAEDCFCTLPTAAKSVDVADYNRDGRPDLYVTGSPLSTLLSRDEGGAWVDVSAIAQASQLHEEVTGWSGIFADLDNDGQRDIVAAQGDRWNEVDAWKAVDVPLQILHQQDGVFVERADSFGISVLGSFRAVVVLDFNDDGVEDLLVSQASDRPLFFLSEGCTDASWIEVDAPVGSKVEVRAGELVQTDWVTMDSGFIATSIPRIHLGLGEEDTIDRITVTLPGGEKRYAAGPIEARRRVVFAE